MYKKSLHSLGIFTLDKYSKWVQSVNTPKMSNTKHGGETIKLNMKYPNIEAERARRGISNDSLAEELGVVHFEFITRKQTAG